MTRSRMFFAVEQHQEVKMITANAMASGFARRHEDR